MRRVSREISKLIKNASRPRAETRGDERGGELERERDAERREETWDRTKTARRKVDDEAKFRARSRRTRLIIKPGLANENCPRRSSTSRAILIVNRVERRRRRERGPEDAVPSAKAVPTLDGGKPCYGTWREYTYRVLFAFPSRAGKNTGLKNSTTRIARITLRWRLNRKERISSRNSPRTR